MSLAELMAAVAALPRQDQFRLMQELVALLARQEGLAAGEYPVWSPYDAHAAAATLLDMLEQDGAQPR